mgnify:CR=1 FL=1
MSIFDLFAKIEKKSAPLQGSVSWLIVGLGNPGTKYEATRHNVGFEAVECVARDAHVQIRDLKFKAVCAQAMVGGARVLLLKPQTFMNLSGEAVRDAAAFYKIPPEHIIVLFDDVSLDCGRLRVRRKGSDGGHNGIKNIIYHLKSDAFPRVKIGVGAPPHKEYDMADWVLGKPQGDDRERLQQAQERAAKAVACVIENGVDAAMNLYNG